jgi:ribosomal protein S21
MTFVVRREGESIDQLVKRFKRAVTEGNVLVDAKRAMFFVSEPEKRTFKAKRASQRRWRAARRDRRLIRSHVRQDGHSGAAVNARTSTETTTPSSCTGSM